jgi:hypothetical protein
MHASASVAVVPDPVDVEAKPKQPIVEAPPHNSDVNPSDKQANDKMVPDSAFEQTFLEFSAVQVIRPRKCGILFMSPSFIVVIACIGAPCRCETCSGLTR